MNTNRRRFMKQLGLGALGAGLATWYPREAQAEGDFKKLSYKFSLAQFSFASEFFSGKHDVMTFPERAKRDFGINIVEYVSMFFADKAGNAGYFKELKKRTDDLGVRNNLIMVDGENIASLDTAKRNHAVESHYPWVDAAKILGCRSIRVNLGSMALEGTADEVAKAAVEGYGKLLEYGDKNQLDIIVENHVGYSCNGQWLASVMKQVNHQRAGVLPDFGNFCVKRTLPETQDLAGYMKTKCLEEYDKYKGMAEIMPYAKGVSAKSHKFDAQGNEAEIDYARMFEIIQKSGFEGIVGIEYEGGLMHMAGMDGYLANEDGIKATKKLVERVA